MKKQLITLVLTTLISSFIWANPIDKKEVNLDKSNITWKAYKVTGSHYGSISLESGSLTFDNDQLTGGLFTVNMETIADHDLEGNWKNKLEMHLKSPDFFDVENHKQSTLVFTKVQASSKNAYSVTADLTIKGITKSVEFVIAIYGNKANATVKVDRAQYDIRYGSNSFFDNLGDKAIYDEFDLVVDLEF